jgi:hypothetical protein
VSLISAGSSGCFVIAILGYEIFSNTQKSLLLLEELDAEELLLDELDAEELLLEHFSGMPRL